MSNPKKSIIIVGGSLAGLLVGLSLKRLGHSVTILERTPTSLLHDQGAGIVFGSEAQLYFRKHIIPFISRKEEEISVRSVKGRQTLGRNGDVVQREGYAQVMISWDAVYFMLRGAFDGFVSEHSRDCGMGDKPEIEGKEGLGMAKYEVGRKIVGIRDCGDEGVEVECEVTKESGEGGNERITLKGDLVIAADGPSSTIRNLVYPDVERTYAGYVAWRGTVLESEASEVIKKTFVDKFTFFHDFEKGIQILAYLIPGKAGNTEVGKRLINWVWYCNYPQDSEAYKDLMTDSDGHRHRFTLPVGKIQPRLVEQQKKYASTVLASPFAELVQATKMPFAQAITDVISPQVSFMNGKLLLVGDAVAGFRPHTAASTNQAAYHALLIEQVFRGEMEMEEMKEEMVGYAKQMSEAGIQMGNRSQFSGGDIDGVTRSKSVRTERKQY